MNETSLMDLTDELFSGTLRGFLEGHAEMREKETHPWDSFIDSPDDALDKMGYYAPFVAQGNSLAQTLTGNILLSLQDNGRIQEALDLLESAVAQDDYWAAYLLGNMYFQGVFKEQDRKRAAGLYAKSAQRHNTHAALLLGKMYEDGIGVDKDLDRAFECYRIASVDWSWHDGKFAAISLIIRNPHHESFYEFTLDFRESCLTALAEEGLPDAQFLLADVLFRGAYGFRHNPVKACHWADRALQNGDMPDDPYADLFPAYQAFARETEEGRFDAAHDGKRKLEKVCKAHFESVKAHWKFRDVFAAYCKPWFEPCELERMIDLMM